jgi:hypothetical protein
MASFNVRTRLIEASLSGAVHPTHSSIAAALIATETIRVVPSVPPFERQSRPVS